MKGGGLTLWNAFFCEIIPFGTMVEYRPISPKDQARIQQLSKKVSPGILAISQSR